MGGQCAVAFTLRLAHTTTIQTDIVLDEISALTDRATPRACWRKLKQRLRDDEGASETVTTCHKLKMRTIDGKLRATDAADAEAMLRIVRNCSRLFARQLVRGDQD